MSPQPDTGHIDDQALWAAIRRGAERTAFADYRLAVGERPLSSPGAEAYGVLREATRGFLIANCGRAAGPRGPCLLEPIWSYWHEEGMLVRSLDAISERFQDRRGGGPDPLGPIADLLRAYVQDEPRRLAVARRNHEYDHHYGLVLTGRPVPAARAADRRSPLLAALHALLARAARVGAGGGDASALLGSLGEVHLILSQGAHNQFGDLPTTSRQEMLMQQWLLARPEVARFLAVGETVADPEPWMGAVDAVARQQAWGETPARRFADLATAGEQILLSIRFGGWAEEADGTRAARWARLWREEVVRYVEAYRAVAGVDLGSRSAA